MTTYLTQFILTYPPAKRKSYLIATVGALHLAFSILMQYIENVFETFLKNLKPAIVNSNIVANINFNSYLSYDSLLFAAYL